MRSSPYPIFDCLYASITESEYNALDRYVTLKQLIPYCRRSSVEDETIPLIGTGNIAEMITFDKLRQQGVTGEQLLQWSAPIDIAERYEMNSQSSEIFYNCSTPWFGSKCQYQFPFSSSLSFSNIVQVFADSRHNVSLNVSVTTCYPFIAGCNRGPWSLCLDWRQICNGVSDCMNGEDERGCEVLEMTVCNEDEYRCHYGGQCIQRAFFRDGVQGTECLDGSEEQESGISFQIITNIICESIVTFRCEERIDRYSHSFPCGNGQFLENVILPANGMGCGNRRNKEVALKMLTSFDHIENVNCRETFRCLLLTDRIYDDLIGYGMPVFLEYFDVTWNPNCESLNTHCSHKWLVLPEYPVLYGFFQFVYFTNRSIEEFQNNIVPDLLCFNANKCLSLLSRIHPIPLIDGLTCCRTTDLLPIDIVQHFNQLNSLFFSLGIECIKAGNEASCSNSSYFHCNESSKCVSYNRVGDGFYDCLFTEDEQFGTCQSNNSNRFNCTSVSDICLLPVALGNTMPNCPEGEDEQQENIYGISSLISYPQICDGYPEEKVDIYGADETNCDLWPCNNPYRRCDRDWDCLNGIDEIGCSWTNCSMNEFPCLNEEANSIYCVPYDSLFYSRTNNCTNDGFVRNIYLYTSSIDISRDYVAFNNSKCISADMICEGYPKVPDSQEDECLLASVGNVTIDSGSTVHQVNSQNAPLCQLYTPTGITLKPSRFFTPARLGFYPPITLTSFPSIENMHNKYQPKENFTKIASVPAWLCHYGVSVSFGTVKQAKACLCPPSYFGSECQWQNQRIALTLQFKIYNLLNVPTAFQLVIMLMDDTGHIMPNHEQLMYMPAHECDTKFNIYLLYPDRPKNSSINYSIRIDLFDKSTLTYWNSWYLSIPFRFLPVNRVASQLIVSQSQRQQPCTLSCGEHGRCTTYSNTDTKQFCRCDQGYSGPSCNESYRCECSKDSYCLSRSICVCPSNKFGSRCYLKRSICESAKNPCENGGICVAQDDRIALNAFVCVCPESYHGDRCEYQNSKLQITIDDTILEISYSYLLHYIEAFDVSTNHIQTTHLKKISFGQNSMTIYFPKPFNIIFIQIPDGDYYLAVLRERFIPSEHIRTRISTNNRCFRIRELFNDTFFNFKYLRRVKYYPLLCRQNPSLMCFYDDQLMCICDRDRFSNCLKMNRTKTHHITGQNICQNGGRYFTNNETCPTSFLCVCTDCYYGRICNFTTRGFIFSLDPILGYHIKANVTIYRQPPIVKFSIAFTSILLLSELTMGSLSIITFLKKESREVGCGYYLLASSASSICMILILTYKFWQLVLSQMAVITSRSFLQFNCVSIEILLKSCLATSEWLHACVAIERMFGVVKGVRFDKKKSRQAAKRIIVVVIVCCVATHLHDPIHRELVDDLDGDQQRTWCLTKYSGIVGRYNSFITFFHFLIPFSINLMSTLILIIKAARIRFNANRNSQQSWFGHLHTKLKQHRHIILSPVILLLLGIPRLIISFSLGCMRSPRQSWLFLIGYFLSFVPSVLTLFVFIVPSKVYKTELNGIIGVWTRRFCRS